jgi:metal-responsive CopG/Arc/MetJ family transcriptional regulator
MSINITITLPEKVIQKIDNTRGDINRSKYILRILEDALGKEKGH